MKQKNHNPKGKIEVETTKMEADELDDSGLLKGLFAGLNQCLTWNKNFRTTTRGSDDGDVLLVPEVAVPIFLQGGFHKLH